MSFGLEGLDDPDTIEEHKPAIFESAYFVFPSRTANVLAMRVGRSGETPNAS